MRNYQKFLISQIIKRFTNSLTHFDDILKELTSQKDYNEFVEIQSAGDFCDGFEIELGHLAGPKALQSYLKDFGMQVNQPKLK